MSAVGIGRPRTPTWRRSASTLAPISPATDGAPQEARATWSDGTPSSPRPRARARRVAHQVSILPPLPKDAGAARGYKQHATITVANTVAGPPNRGSWCNDRAVGRPLVERRLIGLKARENRLDVVGKHEHGRELRQQEPFGNHLLHHPPQRVEVTFEVEERTRLAVNPELTPRPLFKNLLQGAGATWKR